ncbi:hypothetical protein Tco_1253748 [Tanacetum coccineum]
MDWLSKRKFVMVCHEKVVRILLEGDEILRVHGERTQGVVKTLMNTKSKEEHEVHLKLVLETLRKEKLYPKVSKYASLHVPVDKIKVDKTLCFVEEPVENSDREVKRFLTSLLDDGRGSGSWMFLFIRSGYAAMRTLLGAGKIIDSKILVKVRWNSKRGPDFTWEREDYMKSKYPQLFVGRADESAS